MRSIFSVFVLVVSLLNSGFAFADTMALSCVYDKTATAKYYQNIANSRHQSVSEKYLLNYINTFNSGVTVQTKNSKSLLLQYIDSYRRIYEIELIQTQKDNVYWAPSEVKASKYLYNPRMIFSPVYDGGPLDAFRGTEVVGAKLEKSGTNYQLVVRQHGYIPTSTHGINITGNFQTHTVGIDWYTFFTCSK